MFDIDFEFTIGDRPVYWRLRLAKRLAAGPLTNYARRWVDDVVQRAACALGGEPDPHIQAALDLHHNGDVMDRAEVTARILAGQPSRSIAIAVGLPKAVVDLFEQLVFDARNPRAWYSEIPGLNFTQAIEEGDAEAVFNRVGARHGVTMLEPIVRSFRSGLNRARASEEVSQVCDRQQLVLDTYEKLVRALIEPVDLGNMIKAIRQEVEAGVPMPWDQPTEVAHRAVCRTRGGPWVG